MGTIGQQPRGQLITPSDTAGSRTGLHSTDGHLGFQSDFVDEVRQAVGIVRVVEEHVSLKRAGRTLKGLCPFHSEKTPSFNVDEAKGFYYCFGCGAGGDVFRFVMQQEAVTFPEAVRLLADKAGLRVPERTKDAPADQLRERLFAINDAAQQAFVEQLRGARRAPDALRALDYLANRGIGREVVEAFGIGWAPDSWDFIGKRLGGKFEERELTASGLLIPRESGSGCYDRFRGRVTFPIRAVSERVLGFGGRIIGDGEPKYLNSPETPLYTKGRQLFALDRAKVALRRTGVAVLVEGYLDAISLHAHGVENAVAVLGTALTAEQARLVGRFARKVVLNFDGDAAGIRATRKNLEVLLAEGLDVKVMELPAGVDPDDHVRAVGGDAYRSALDKAPGFFDFLLRSVAKEQDLTTPSGRVSALNELLPYIAVVHDRLLRSELVDAACHGLGIRAEIVRDEVDRALRKGQKSVDVGKGVESAEASHAEEALLAWMLGDERARDAVRGIVDDAGLAVLPKAEIYRAILAAPSEKFDVAAVIDGLPESWQKQLVSRCAVSQHHEPIDASGVGDKVRAFLEELGLSDVHVAKRRKAEVNRELTDATKRNDNTNVRQLLAEAQALGRSMHR